MYLKDSGEYRWKIRFVESEFREHKTHLSVNINFSDKRYARV